MKRLVGFLLIVISLTASAQKGYLRGNVLDGDFGGPMIGATVYLTDNKGVGTAADMDGNFSLPLDPGTYSVSVSFISYATKTFENIEIKAGEVTTLDVTLTSAAEQLEAFEVVAEARKSTEVATLMNMKKATVVSEGLSSQTIKKTGDSDLGDAMKRVTGVTVQGGKYVFVRGLGDRYTKATLNGMELPGLDPDKNSVQIDIFPTSVLENLTVSKTFSPDLDGDFTGGLINIETKKFPEIKKTSVNFGLTYIPGMHFNNDYILYTRSKTDWLGYDDGSRKHPVNPNQDIPHPVQNDPELEDITKSFNSELAVKKQTALPNMSFGFNHGNQINAKGGSTFGYNLVLNYRNKTTFYEEFQSNDYLKDTESDRNELVRVRERKGPLGRNSVLWSGLVSGSWKKEKSTVSIAVLNTQSGEASATKRTNNDFNQNQASLIEDVLTYQQRTLFSTILSGQHRVGFGEIEWGNAFSRSRVYDPDFRETRISITDGDTTLATGAGAGIDRFWRDLHETNNTTKVSAKFNMSESFKLKAGLVSTLKWRNFETYSYKHRRGDLSNVSIDPNWYLQDENVWTTTDDPATPSTGTFVLGTFQPANQYDARQTLFGAFVMAEQALWKKLKLVYGVRAEKVDMYYTGENNTGTVKYLDQKTLDELNILPSLNINYELNKKMNVRAAATRTVARPTFREKSIAQVYDPITKRTFVGNIDLDQTVINNFDLRYEYYITPTELFSVAAFYKQFDGHIEMVSFVTAPDNIKPRNSGDADVMGVEFEMRKAVMKSDSVLSYGGGFASNLKTIASRLFVTTNVSLVKSSVDMQSVVVDNNKTTEYDIRKASARDGEDVKTTRRMSGQSPYAVNFVLSYKLSKKNGNLSLAYNVQGEQLTIIGSGLVPDVYTLPFHSLNLNVYEFFGEKKRSKVTFSLNNILDEDRTLVYKSYKAQDQIFTSYKPGVQFGIKYAYTW